ncbi:putative bifunctional lysine-specific demethylase and histidyl-hydroxylase NO66-like [Scophthalmus maximus]|uniref:Putative bifunctional lysine-specific demethylase and histidyl-hydroxylase NO66-like n=2 Tax=Scophthalmus maximus TaxID=52904 RepID=A0A2U9B6V6_SCOMX|nr:putative bifunctional lysine-specific demethylase and histidyl-hydroxylase NO66-like [Scophthalmus maximus]
MELLRKYMWLWVICGILFVSLAISFIFLLINKCLSRGGKHRVSHLQRRSAFNVG